MYSIFIYDKNKNTFILGRDHVGIIPVYYGLGKENEIYICSEIKGIHD